MVMELLRRIDKCRRVVATGISFLVFGFFALSLSCAVIPFFCVFAARNPVSRSAVAQFCICMCFRFFIRMMHFLGALDYRFENAELLAGDDGCLIAANHPSLLDYVFLTSLMPRCDCVVKESLWNNFFMRGVIRSAGYIPNRSAEEVLACCREKFSAGGRILVFPEGTRTMLGRPIELKRSAANIAVRCGADVRTVRITCEPPILTKQQKWWQTAPTRPLFVIRVGEKIRIADFVKNASSPSSAARRLNERLASVLASTTN